MSLKALLRSAIPLLAISLFASGCAQVMAIRQPRPFTPAALTNNAKRVDVIAELGQPLTSEEHSNLLTDAYAYVDGGSKNNGAAKAGRIVLYTAGDVFTVFLDQIIWMPTEHFGFAGTDHSVMVDYAKSTDGLWHAVSIQNKVVKGPSAKKDAI